MGGERGRGKSVSMRGSGGPLGGAAVGIVLALLYVKFGFALPAWLSPVKEIEGLVVATAAALATDGSELAELQRGIALEIGRDPEYYTRIDNALGQFITAEVTWRERTKRDLMLLRGTARQLAEQSADRSGPLRASMERLLGSLVRRTKAERALAYDFLRLRFPGMTDAEIVAQLTTISVVDLLQITYPSAPIVFTSPGRGLVTLEVRAESGERVATLLDAELPAGQYRVYWDYRDASGKPRPTDGEYTFALQREGELVRSGRLEPPKAVWE